MHSRKDLDNHEAEPDDLVGPLRYNQVYNNHNADELWGAKPNCRHHIVCPPGGGILCTKCGGWCCY